MNRISISVWQKFVSMYTLLRVIEQCCFNSVPDLFNGQTVDFILKPPKVVESRTYVNNMKQHCSITLTIGLVIQLMQMQPGVHTLSQIFIQRNSNKPDTQMHLSLKAFVCNLHLHRCKGALTSAH